MEEKLEREVETGG